MKSSPPMTAHSTTEGALLTSVEVDEAADTPADAAQAAAVRLEAEIVAFGAVSPAITAAHWQRVRARCADIGPAVTRLIDDAEASDGGKHMRPRLVAAAYLGMGGADQACSPRSRAPSSCSHLGLCMHDDLIDGDRVRHGGPNLIGRSHDAAVAAGAEGAAAERQALAAGLLAGDLALNAALLALLDASAPLSVRHRLAVEATTELERTIAGELLDVQSETITPDRAAPLRVAELKTAAYSVVLPLRLGAVAAGCTSEPTLAQPDRRSASRWASRTSSPTTTWASSASPRSTGKSVLSDVRQGKRTEHIRIAYARPAFADRATLDAVLGRPDATDARRRPRARHRAAHRRPRVGDAHDRRAHEPGHPTRRHGRCPTRSPPTCADLARSMRGRRR